MKFLYQSLILALVVLCSGNIFANSPVPVPVPVPVSVGGTLQTATANNLDSVCAGSNTGTLNLSGQFGSIVRWEYSNSGGNPWSTITHTGVTYTYSNLTSTTYFRAIVKNGADPEAASSSVQIRVDQSTVVGTLTGNATVCTNNNSGTLSVGNGVGAIYSWQTSFNNGSTWNENATSATTQSYTNLTATTWYRVVAKNGACKKDTSNVSKVIVNTQTIGGSVLASNGLSTSTVCSGINEDTLTLSGHLGNVLGWEQANSNNGPWSYSFNSKTKEPYKNLSATAYYRAIIHNPGCDTVYSAIGRINIDPVSNAGAISGTTDLCTGTNSAVLTVKSSNGSIQNWLTSTNGTNYNVLANPLKTYNITNLTQTTYFKTFTKSGVCSNDTSAAFVVNVNAATVGGNVSGTSNICHNINSGSLVLSGNTGKVIRWQSSFTGNNPWIDIVKLDSSLAYSNMQTTTSYRAVVQNEGCSVMFSSPAKLTIDPTSVAGVLSGTGAVCISGNSGKIVTPNKTGTTTNWLKSTDSGANWSIEGSTTDTISFTNINTETWYRSIIKSGTCAADSSSIGKITISPATVGGSVSGSATVCASSNGATINLSGHTGNVVRWESAPNSGVTWGSINNTTTSLTYSNLVSNAYYRAIVQSTNCNEVASSSAFIEVIPEIKGGNLNGSKTVCDASNSGIIILNNQSGIIDKWQISTDTMQTWTDVNNTTIQNNFSNLTITTHYRVQLSGGVCGTELSDTAAVWVNSSPIANFSVPNTCHTSVSKFSNQTINGNSNTYFWDFSDGSTGLNKNPNYIFTKPGSFNVTLVATSADNCKSTISKTVVIDTIPDVKFTNTTVCVGTATEFTNTSTPANGTSTWTFGNGNTSAAYSPNESYTTHGNYQAQLIFKSANNCSDTIAKTITVNATPSTIWNAPTTAEGKALTFANNSSIATGTLGYLWNFGDGNNSNTQNPTHTYADTGNYSVELISYTQFCNDTLKKTVVVNPIPRADFSVNRVCVSDSAKFLNNSFVKKGNMTFSWTFGDGSISSEENPIYKYTTPGAYNILMEATSDSGYTHTKQFSIVIYESPAANFSSTNVCAGDTTLFTDNSFLKGGTLSHLWKFGPVGAQSININPKYAYTSAGSINATLRVTSNNGCVDSISKPVVVYALPSVNFSADSVCFGASTQLSDSTKLVGATIGSYSWDFGNSNGSNVRNPLHKYTNYGTYLVKLKATTNQGCVDSLSKNVLVNALPTAAFSATNACITDSSVFTNTSTYPFAGSSLAYVWDFGDAAGNSTLANPKYAYSTDGSFTTSLVVTESGTNCKDSITRLVVAHPRSNPSFSSSSVCLGQGMSFQNNSTVKLGNLTSAWNFGDLNTSNNNNPKHQYSNSGTYNVRLITTTINNCTDTATASVWVNPQPATDFTLNNVCFEDSAFLFDNSAYSSGANIPDTTVTFSWDFGDGNTDTLKNPKHFYTGPGNYKITLVQTTDSGCTDQMTKNITVYANPVADFIFTNVCFKDSTPFTNRSFSVQGKLSYLWDFGNTNTDTLEDVNFLFPTQGNQSVELVSTSEFGCTDTIIKQVISYEIPEVDFVFESICDGFKMPFTDSTKIARGSIVSFTWDFGDGTSANIPSPAHLYLNNGKYDVNLKAVSDKNCIADTIKQVEVYEVPVSNFSVDNACLYNDLEPNNVSTITNGTITFKWTLDSIFESIIPKPVFTPEIPGVYKLKLVSSSQNNCKDSIIRNVEIYKLPEILIGNDTTISKGFEIQLLAQGGIEYDWIPQTGLNNSTIADPVFTAKEESIFTVTGTDEKGCSNTATQTILTNNDFNVIPTNVITPDGNGQNDFWVIQNIENYQDGKIAVYDRWGGEVLNTTEYQNDWDGRNAKGDILPDGAYYYTISFPDSERTYKGALTILRNNK